MKFIIAQWNWLPEKIRAKENKNISKEILKNIWIIKISFVSLHYIIIQLKIYYHADFYFKRECFN